MVSILIVSMAQVSDPEDKYSDLYFRRDMVEGGFGPVVIPGFVWRREKSNRNIEKHGFSFYYARRIWGDGKPVLRVEDVEHSESEARFHSIGRAHLQPGKTILVCETEVSDNVTRIFSAWVLTGGSLKTEFEEYEKQSLAQSKKNYDYLKSLYDRMF